MNCCNRTYLQDTNPIDITWAWPRGRLDINDEIITKNGENEKNVVSFLTEVKELRSVTDIKKIKDIVKKIFGESLEGRKIMQLMDKSIENSFEPQQLNSLDNSQNIKLNNVHIIVMLKMILEVLLDPQNLNEWMKIRKSQEIMHIIGSIYIMEMEIRKVQIFSRTLGEIYMNL